MFSVMPRFCFTVCNYIPKVHAYIHSYTYIRGETIWIITILHIAFQCIAIYCHIAIHDQTLLKTISWERLVHNYTFSMQLIKAESQRQALIITFMHLFVILFFNLLQTTHYLAIYCNILQYIDIL